MAEPFNRRDDFRSRVGVLPSDQISRVLDFYLRHMLQPIALYTDVLFDKVAEILLLLTNGRRKITTADRADCIETLFRMMVNNDRENIVQFLLEVGIERNILLDVIDRVLNAYHLDNCTCELEPLQRHLRVLLDDLMTFREHVFERYTGLVVKNARIFAWSRRGHGLLVETDDAQQNHALAALRGLDKVNTSSGPIAKFVNKWMRNAAHSQFSNHLGESFSVTRNVRKKMSTGNSLLNNHSLPIDNESIQEMLVSDDDEMSKNTEFADTLLSILKANGLMESVRWAVLLSKLRIPMTPLEMRRMTEPYDRTPISPNDPVKG